MKKLILLIFFFAFSAAAYAEQGHMKLLAVKETENGTLEGGIADLYLEIMPGSGRVFLETFPLTRTDTQMSTRFAKAIACSTVQKDCDNFDFFYTITADSAIIAGPSAGAAIAVLTASMLENDKLNKDYAITGTINSGGLIGPVGGVKEKVEAANEYGIDKVLIPSGEVKSKEGNKTIDIYNLSKQIGIEILEVSTLEDAYEFFTGKKISKKYDKIELNPDYLKTMESLAKGLCERSKELELKSEKSNSSSLENARNLTLKGSAAFSEKKFYSSASYCFGSNVEYTYLMFKSEKNNSKAIKSEASLISKKVSEFEKEIEKKEKVTITDLEAYIVVKERLRDATDTIKQALEFEEKNETEKALRFLAYASERLNSAHSWSQFFGINGKQFYIDKEALKESCQDKINEATERKQYVELYIPSLEGVQKQIQQASNELRNKNYELCLSIASKAKADVDVILGVFGVEESQYKGIAERKLEIARNSIARQSSKDIFPILGYSYYEYSNSLIEGDVLSSLLYAEYSMELGNLDIYFKQKSKVPFPRIDLSKLGIFLSGFLAGILVIIIIGPFRKQRMRNNN